MTTEIQLRFTEFYQNWSSKLEQILDELLEVSKEKNAQVLPSEQDLRALTSKVNAHLKEYYTVKWMTAREDVLIFFSPSWLSPLESAFMWVTGWKPSTAFRVIQYLQGMPLAGLSRKTLILTEDQRKKLDDLKKKNRMEEDKVEREMERLQVSLADHKILPLARLSSGVESGDGAIAPPHLDGLVEGVIRGIMGTLEKIVKVADCLRMKTVKDVLEVLTPMQGVEFLAAYLFMMVSLRRWRKKPVEMTESSAVSQLKDEEEDNSN